MRVVVSRCDFRITEPQAPRPAIPALYCRLEPSDHLPLSHTDQFHLVLQLPQLVQALYGSPLGLEIRQLLSLHPLLELEQIIVQFVLVTHQPHLLGHRCRPIESIDLQLRPCQVAQYPGLRAGRQLQAGGRSTAHPPQCVASGLGTSSLRTMPLPSR